MKALVVQQPWAHLILEYGKTIETRRRKIKYRGDLLICVSQTISQAPDVYFFGEIRKPESLFYHHSTVDFRLGQALCVVTLVDCRPMVWEDRKKAFVEYNKHDKLYAWVLENPRLVESFAVRGMPGIFEVDDSLIQIKHTS